MKPVEQVCLGADGDCFRACMASILELPLAAVPHFAGDDQHERYGAWLAQFGLGLLTFRLDQAQPWPSYARYPGLAIVAAESPLGNGRMHGVVVRCGTIVHDPHPNRHLGVGAWREMTVLTVLDPVNVERRT